MCSAKELRSEERRVGKECRTFPAERMQAMATEMFGAWVHFIATGDPGWPRYTPEDRVTRLFDDVSTTVSDPDREQRLLWMP